MSFGHPLFVPQVVVVLDPATTVSTPLTLLLSTGMKAVDHAVERFSMLSLVFLTDLAVLVQLARDEVRDGQAARHARASVRRPRV
jgi:alcohol dehydrogenase class IV